MPGATFIEGETVDLRTVEEGDLAFLREGDNDPGTRRLAGGDALPVSLAEERAAWEDLADRDAVQLIIADADDGTSVGMIELDPIDFVAGNAEIGFWIAPAYRGLGYVPEPLDLIVAYAFGTLRLHRVHASVYAFNERSMELLRQVGFARDGVHREEGFVDGEHVDVHYFSVLDDD